MLANILSIIRILCGIALAFYLNVYLLILGCITDFLDGYIARKFNQVSHFGAQLDQIADKIFCNGVLIGLHCQGKTVLLPSLILLIRDLYVNFLRSKKDIPVNSLGKVKTSIIMIALLALTLNYHHCGLILLWIGALLSWYTVCLVY
jgi:CDP-diacylglycerol--glycerol-3-phosphate 3-phosphatidyltransferase